MRSTKTRIETHPLNLYSECYTLSQYEIHQNKDWNFIPLSDYMKNFDVTIWDPPKQGLKLNRLVSDDNYYLVTIWDPPKQGLKLIKLCSYEFFTIVTIWDPPKQGLKLYYLFSNHKAVPVTIWDPPKQGLKLCSTSHSSAGWMVTIWDPPKQGLKLFAKSDSKRRPVLSQYEIHQNKDWNEKPISQRSVILSCHNMRSTKTRIETH